MHTLHRPLEKVPSPPLELIHLVSRNHHVSVLIYVLEGLEGLHVLWHLLQASLQQQRAETACTYIFICLQTFTFHCLQRAGETSFC